MPPDALHGTGIQDALRDAVRRFALSARAVARIWRVARTIADLSGMAGVSAPDVAEALQYRTAPTSQ